VIDVITRYVKLLYFDVIARNDYNICVEFTLEFTNDSKENEIEISQVLHY